MQQNVFANDSKTEDEVWKIRGSILIFISKNIELKQIWVKKKLLNEFNLIKCCNKNNTSLTGSIWIDGL